jgi:S-DNA-T family DNA segregation ATPase FtsK/SpoIIIE
VIALAEDIARSMSATAARVAVIPGRNAIGIELPNPTRQTVYLRDLLSAQDFKRSRAALPLALGESIEGHATIADLGKMPHLLIAGTTGSGKSVGINAMILSLMFKLPPEKCRFIMIDPKMLELSIYEGVPHLLAPVVTDPAKAVLALKWVVREMESRYDLMSKLGVRNIAGFNQKAEEAAAKGEDLSRQIQTGWDKETGEPIWGVERVKPEAMHHIVVVIDEVADLMMVAGKDIEAAVQRLAQMARAAGIHLIMATQRPSVDVITGTIKANFPTRISYMVTSKIDSRTILGEQGAEQLLGMGDLLWMASGGKIVRVHGPFVSDEEVERVVSWLKDQGAPQYVSGVTDEIESEDVSVADAAFGTSSGDPDEDMYREAVAAVIRDKRPTTSYVQRILRIGYNRAASMIERMEREGIISAADHSGKRQILTRDTGRDRNDDVAA